MRERRLSPCPVVDELTPPLVVAGVTSLIPTGPGTPNFDGLCADGSIVLFTTTAQLVPADTVAPGSIAESARTVWALDRLQVYASNSLFATQGLFIP